MGYEKDIPIKNLHLYLQNPRCLFVETEEDALCELLLDQGGDKSTNKIVSLAKSIITKGWIPTELLIVRPSKTDKDSFVVMEGNRRLTALKSLDNPGYLPDSFPTVRAAFEKMSLPDIPTVKCYVTDDQAEINRLIELRHNGQNQGAGIIPWDSVQRTRFMERTTGKKDKIIQLIEYLHSYFDAGSNEELWLSKCNKTNLERLFSTPYVREKLGFSLANSTYVAVNPDPIILSRFIQRVSEANVGRIYYARDRKLFIDEILEEFEVDTSDGTQEIDFGDETTENPGKGSGSANSGDSASDDRQSDSGNDNGGEGPRSKGHDRNRHTVAPRTGAPLATQGEANLAQIHYELKSVNVYEAPIACALLLRALITVSTDLYLAKKLEQDEYKELNPKVATRIERACKELVHDETCSLGNNDVDYMRKFIQNNDKLPVTLSSLHSPAHGSNGWPDGEALKSLWDKTYKVIREMLSYTQNHHETD